jgi:O-6-methylguanine DNA methyltransferase
MRESLYYTTHSTSIGVLLLVGAANGLNYLTLLDDGDDAIAHLTTRFQPLPTQLLGFFDSTTQAIDRYLNNAEPLSIPVHFSSGTLLQRAVWLALSKIPHGETISYTTLAERVGFPRAVRAVASACAANPVPLVVPCHRVLAKDGTLGGFSLGGLQVKEYLITLEKSTSKAAA